VKRRRIVFGASYWDLVEAFFEAQRQYNEVYEYYERTVLWHAEEQAVDRHQLRLEASEVSKLLDFAKLGELRSGPLYRTKEISHSLFRSKGRTHKFDRYISEIFHDLSILREEQFKVSTFAEEYKRGGELAEYESLLDEVHEDFPRRVHNIWGLFIKAQHALEGVLRAHSRDPLYLRSLFLFGDEIFKGTPYLQARTSHCWRVFDRGPAEAYLLAARSFAQSGFKAQAQTVLDDCLRAAGEGPQGSCTAEELQQIETEAEALKRVVAQRTPAELVAMTLVEDPMQGHHGDDSAPDLGIDFGSHDETWLEEEAEIA
jgi:hypothetical protein